jgi:hypothetical protein
MRILLSFLLTGVLLAQDKPVPDKAATDKPAPSPLPSAESRFTGTFEVGERWLTGVGGSFNTYRSVVDLGSGPKLIGADFTISGLQSHYFDRIRVRAHDWGDDPYSGLHILAEKQGFYEFNTDYRRVAYFNNLPSYADPLLTRGIIRNEQSFDTRRRLASFTLDLLPNKRISPYIAYDRDSSHGSGVTVLVTGGDEFAVPATLRDSTDLYRGGVHFTGARFHLTLEAGGNTFRSDQNTFTSTTLAPNPGNNRNPVLGATLGLSSLLQDSGVRGNGVFTKALLTATPFSWLDVYGHFLFSQPRNDVSYLQFNTGSFVLLSQVLFYNSEQYLVTAASKLPHTSADVGVEIRPLQKLRILQSLLTDRLHNTASAAQADTLFASAGFIGTQLQQSLATNFNQSETNAIADLRPNLTVRGGYRYVWGDGRTAVFPASGIPGLAHESIRRNIGLGAVNWHPWKKLTLIGEFELGASDGAYFRTSLYNYRKVRAMGRYQLRDSVHLTADYTTLSNSNPNLTASYRYLIHQESASLTWNPSGRKYDLQATYEHCGYHSRISYLIPQLLTSADSVYSENCHTVSGLLHTTYKNLDFTGGGAVALSSGSRPTAYYQPVAKVSMKLTKSLGAFAEWRYYGLGETFYMYESFRAHLFTTGLRISR